ncbi:10065_t:CDS:1, partial [Gigaspora margarita]
MFKVQWRQKLAKNKNGDPPNDEHFPLIEIIYKLPRTEIFNPCQDTRKLYPHQNKRRSKGDPRPMNSFMILTLVVRRVAEIRNVDLGDGRSCIRICQLMRWGASKDEWGIYLTLQKEFRKIHSRLFPAYDYRKKPQVADTKEFVVVNSDDFKAEILLSESRNRKISSPTESYERCVPINNHYPAITSPQASNVSNVSNISNVTPYSSYNGGFISHLNSPDSFSPPSPVSQAGSFIVSSPSSVSTHEIIVPSSSPVGSPYIPQVNSPNAIISSSPQLSQITQVGGQDIISSSSSITQIETQIVIPSVSLPQSYFPYPSDTHSYCEQRFQNTSLPTIA